MDGTSVEAKKQAWIALTNKYNAVSETGFRTEKQLHALYDNIKKKARKNMSDDKSEMYKTGGGTFCPKTTPIDEKIVALLTPQFKPLDNEFDSSAPYYSLDIEKTQVLSKQAHSGTSQDIIIVPNLPLYPYTQEDLATETQATSSKQLECSKRPISPCMKDFETPKLKKMCLTETKKKNINNLSDSIIKRKNQKQINEDAITSKRLEILELQRQQEVMKLEKNKILLDIDIELKTILLENARMDLEFKKRNFNL